TPRKYFRHESIGQRFCIFFQPPRRTCRGCSMNSANILVVDDEPQIRRVLRSTLTSQGYVLTDAKTGEEGVDIARKDKPDLILMDVNMPGMGGIAACREIRGFSAAPIIMLTVRNAERDKVQAL